MRLGVRYCRCLLKILIMKDSLLPCDISHLWCENRHLFHAVKQESHWE